MSHVKASRALRGPPGTCTALPTRPLPTSPNPLKCIEACRRPAGPIKTRADPSKHFGTVHASQDPTSPGPPRPTKARQDPSTHVKTRQNPPRHDPARPVLTRPNPSRPGPSRPATTFQYPPRPTRPGKSRPAKPRQDPSRPVKTPRRPVKIPQDPSRHAKTRPVLHAPK